MNITQGQNFLVQRCRIRGWRALANPVYGRSVNPRTRKNCFLANFCVILKVFDVVLNGDLTIASDLDVFERVGRGVAHDEYIDFEVKDGKILYEGDESEISAGKIRVEFIKSYRDNPKVNAIIVGKGSLSGMYNIFICYSSPPQLRYPQLSYFCSNAILNWVPKNSS